MPHVVYLHSGLTQDRIKPRNDREARRLFRFTLADVFIAMPLAGVVARQVLGAIDIEPLRRPILATEEDGNEAARSCRRCGAGSTRCRLDEAGPRCSPTSSGFLRVLPHSVGHSQ
jgi:hypothetical protein